MNNPQMKKKAVVTEDGQTVRYDLYQNGNTSLIVIAHGFFNSKDALLLKELGRALSNQYDVAIMDFRGHGESPGLFLWTAKEHLDLIAVMNDARANYKRIGVIGFSLGAATSIIAAAKTDLIDSLAAVSGPTEFEKIEYRFWEMDPENDILYNLIGEGRVGKGVRPGPFWMKKDKPIELIDKVKCPVMILHGEADWLIKPWHAQALYDRATAHKKLAIIPNGPHAEYLVRKNKDETVAAIRSWFEETL